MAKVRSSRISWKHLVETYDPHRRSYQPGVYFFGGYIDDTGREVGRGVKRDPRRPFYVRDNE